MPNDKISSGQSEELSSTCFTFGLNSYTFLENSYTIIRSGSILALCDI